MYSFGMALSEEGLFDNIFITQSREQVSTTFNTVLESKDQNLPNHSLNSIDKQNNAFYASCVASVDVQFTLQFSDISDGELISTCEKVEKKGDSIATINSTRFAIPKTDEEMSSLGQKRSLYFIYFPLRGYESHFPILSLL